MKNSEMSTNKLLTTPLRSSKKQSLNHYSNANIINKAEQENIQEYDSAINLF